MSNYRVTWVSLSLGLLLLSLASHANGSMNVELLRANFNDKPLDTQIGAGGAIVGEPVSVPADLIAKVQAAPFATPSLHLKANTILSRYARFDFIGAEEIHSGELRISFTLRTPPVLDRFRVWIRDQVTATAILGGLDFRPDGIIQTLEATTFIATYAPNQTLHIEYVYQVAANSYDLFINGVQKFDDRAQSSATPDKGIGALEFGFPTNTGSDEWAVDDILVLRTPGLLNADFDDKPLNTQIGTGGPSVGEPTGINQNLIAMVQAGIFATPALVLNQAMPGSTVFTSFKLLNGVEVVAGELRISFRIRTAPIDDQFRVAFRNDEGNGLSFARLDLTFGNIRVTDTSQSPLLGTFIPGDDFSFEFRYAMDAGTYDVYINRVLVLDDRAHGAGAMGRGIGTILLASSTTQEWTIDDLFVYQPGALFQDGFD